MLLFLQVVWIMTTSVAFKRVYAGQQGGVPLTCECSTSQCQQQGTKLCTTREGLCFTEYLERGRGRPSFIRGCTDGRTPLLCENRRPVHVKSWPLLHCCDADLCNRGAVPTPPGLVEDGDSIKNMEMSGVVNTTKSLEESQQLAELDPESSNSSLLSSVQKNPWPHIVSPVYVSVLVLGIVSLIVIGIVAATVIRRNNRFYADQYGALEFQPGKVTHHHCDCDSEVDSVGSSQPYLHIVCSNRDT